MMNQLVLIKLLILFLHFNFSLKILLFIKIQTSFNHLSCPIISSNFSAIGSCIRFYINHIAILHSFICLCLTWNTNSFQLSWIIRLNAILVFRYRLRLPLQRIALCFGLARIRSTPPYRKSADNQ